MRVAVYLGAVLLVAVSCGGGSGDVLPPVEESGGVAERALGADADPSFVAYRQARRDAIEAAGVVRGLLEAEFRERWQPDDPMRLNLTLCQGDAACTCVYYGAGWAFTEIRAQERRLSLAEAVYARGRWDVSRAVPLRTADAIMERYERHETTRDVWDRDEAEPRSCAFFG